MTTKTFSEILLRRRNKLNIKSVLDNKTDNIRRVMVMMKNVNDLGYTFSKELVEYMRHLPDVEQNSIYMELVSCLKEYTGADKNWTPMYENFPECMLDGSISDLELLVNAFVVYLTDSTLVPDYKKNERLPLMDDPKLTVLDLGTSDDLDEVMNNLITSKTSLSETDKADMIALINQRGLNYKKLPDTIPFKENVAVISKIIKENTPSMMWFQGLSKYLKTATDVLRFVVYLNDGDVSLATPTKFKSMPRRERDLILHLLNKCNSLEEDMKRYETAWIRLGEVLHPSEDKYMKYFKSFTAFNKLRNGGEIYNFNREVDNKIKNKDLTVLNTLKNRPGEFARRLDLLLRTFTDSSFEVIEAFREIATQISVPVLLQVKEHFTYRNYDSDSRVFFPKGQLAKVYSIKNELENISLMSCRDIVRVCTRAITEQFKNNENKKNLGNVYIDESIMGYCVPQSQRSASKCLKPVTRGSRLPIGKDVKSCRGFIWWTNVGNSSNRWDKDRVDIDLSAAILDENFGYISHISYTNLRDAKFRGCHSGDITNGGVAFNPDGSVGKGACEFIDVDIDSVVKNGGRYIVYQVYSFTGQKFSDMPHVMFGWMKREDVNSGEVFEASTVEQRIDLTSETTTAIPVLFDCVTREYIWMDIAGNINNMNRSCANIERNLMGVSAMCYGIVNGHKPQMFDLAVLNTIANGQQVYNRDEADTIFDTNTEKPIIKVTKTIEIQNEKGEVIETKEVVEEKIKDCRIITPWDIDCWMSEML